jgi:hypothetical protein
MRESSKGTPAPQHVDRPAVRPNEPATDLGKRVEKMAAMANPAQIHQIWRTNELI